MKLLYCTVALALLTGLSALAQTATNLGLVGVGRVSGDGFDQLGPFIDSMGGIGSSLFVNQSSLARSGDAVNGFTYSGTLYGVPDRGFNGATRITIRACTPSASPSRPTTAARPRTSRRSC